MLFATMLLVGQIALGLFFLYFSLALLVFHEYAAASKANQFPISPRYMVAGLIALVLLAVTTLVAAVEQLLT